MAVNMSGEYVGGLNVQLRHGPSGREITTAAPVDNHGDGSSFSPTDLAASSLAACILTVMGIVAERDGVDLRGARFELEKHMRADPRRIDRIPMKIYMPAGLTASQRKKLERTAHACPVHKSLREEIDKDIEFVYPD
ncbi:MAG: OsmC family protein [Thermoanaerobaculia bacterium]|nr:OsmC family protein [Thermoanaerobaculia bacterium]